ncbi:hypothetical protein QUF72_04510 [Desulfobacterales bacterium HSG2]|nr:hypothetical protein [Desulfobacterales bacterium HSG2]
MYLFFRFLFTTKYTKYTKRKNVNLPPAIGKTAKEYKINVFERLSVKERCLLVNIQEYWLRAVCRGQTRSGLAFRIYKINEL